MRTLSIKDRIRQFFFLNPTAKLRVRQIERQVKVPIPSAIRYAKELKFEGILKTDILGGVILYSADRSLPKFLREKRLANIKALYASGLIDFLIEKKSNPTIVLFGSFSRGEDVEESDIDLYIELQKKQDIDVKYFERVLRRPIQIFSYKSINDVENKELANNILNGFVLNGFVEVFS